jgi:ABC-2 type transport system permease protein/sodium transport system permease protein
MNRLSRVNTIWRKELVDTLRDRRTLIAMILVPIVLYPAMILGSLQGFELQVSRLKQEEYRVGVLTEPTRAWLRYVIDTDPARQPGAEPDMPAEELVEKAAEGELEDTNEPMAAEGSPTDVARYGVRRSPPSYVIEVMPDPDTLIRQVLAGDLHVGVALGLPAADPNAADPQVARSPFPTAEGSGSASITVVLDQTEIRSQLAATGLEGIFERAADALLSERLERLELERSFVTPIELHQESVATPEKVGGSILGQIVPLILIVMTITGAIYPAIDLTAGERERGTLETLMVAPVPTVDLIAGKFIVVALIGMISAALNLIAIGGTVYLGGLGQLLSRGGEVVIPLSALPWVLLVLIPLAVMFSATLLAVCSFARSFKEAQNYVMPVMVAALIPAVVGVLPGMRLEGPLLIMPVTNITILTRDLFTGRFDVAAILWVTLSTTLYAGAAVAVAAKLFGQEAVLFADSGSIKTIFQRRFFKRADHPGAAQALLLLAFVFSLNFFAQQSLLNRPGVFGTMWYWAGLTVVLVVLFLLFPVGAAAYSRVNIAKAFNLRAPTLPAIAAALCFGLSTWVLVTAWSAFQQSWLPIPLEMEQAFEQMVGMLGEVHPLTMIFFMALVPGICEEFFFRGYALSGLQNAVGKWTAIVIVGFAFGVYHFSVHRLIPTAVLGVAFGLLVIQYRSIWPAVLAHLLNNGILMLSQREDGLKPLLDRLGYAADDAGYPPVPWIVGAAGVTLAGILVCLLAPKPESTPQPAERTTEGRPVG